MDQNNVAEQPSKLQKVRRSERCNKGVPPLRYASELDKAAQNSSIVTKDVKSVVSDHTSPAEVESGELENGCIPESISVRSMRSVVVPNVLYVPSNKSNTNSEISSITRMNLELTLMNKQKELDQKVLKEKLEALERERQYLNKEAEIQRKYMVKSKASSVLEDEQVPFALSAKFDQSPATINEWVDASRKYIDEVNENTPNMHKISSECNFATSEINFPNSAGGGGDSALRDIARMCIENTNTTNKFFLRNRMRDLPQFSGDLSEWPIFINEFRRSTEQFALSQEDNLLRLDKALKGRARDSVRALLTFPSNVPKIMKMLEMNFGRAEWIVLSLIDKVKKLNNVREDKLDSWIQFSNAVNNMVTTMKNVNSSLYLFNPELVATLLEKLPTILKFSWGKFKHLRDAHSLQTSLEDFADWFEEELSSMAAFSNPFQRTSSSKNCLRKENVMISKGNHAQKSDFNPCIFCKKTGHYISKCTKFIDLSVQKRRENVVSLKLCFLCLKLGHMATKCFLKARCGEDGCRGRHHSLLHVPRDQENHNDAETITRIENEPTNEASAPDFCVSLTNKSPSLDTRVVLLRIAPVILRGPTGEIKTYALFDEGSTCSMIEEDLAKKLQLTGPVVPLCFQWTNEITHYEDKSQMVSLDVSADKNTPVFFNLKQVRTVKNLKLPGQRINVDDLSRRFPYLDHDILKSLESAKPELLIGQDNCGLIIPRHVIQPKLNQPIMSLSKLGWTIHGATGETNVLPHVNLCCRHIGDEELHQIVKDSFRLEAFGVKIQDNIIKSLEDKRAVERMEKTLRRVGNHYEIGLPWKQKDCILPSSKSNALKRLLCMERKMTQDPKFAEQYNAKIAEYMEKGYATKLNPSEIPNNGKTWYLPHFAVWNINKPGKIRMVFDAAAKAQGSSLNDFLYQGPDFVPSLISVLCRFRQHKIAFGGDIKDMFHRVHIIEEDRSAQLFLWRGGQTNKEPDVYCMKVMIFGAVSSPSVAQFVKNKNASLFEQKYPGIVRAMEKQHYVDDYLDSCSTEDEAIHRIQAIIDIHRYANFEMVKWMSNSSIVIESIPKNLRADSQIDVKIDSQTLERVLGLSWSVNRDVFIFCLNLKKIPSEISSGLKVPTKREVLRMIMSIFDPLGFIAPLMISARILMQNIWRNNIHWDQEITEDISEAWFKWLKNLKEATPVMINRYYFPRLVKVKKVDLHLFSDASDKAYSAVAFIRTVENDEIYTAFVLSKYKVAPMSQQTVPKLELQGAVLANRLAKTIRSEIEYEIEEIHFWTDSMVVLQQIRSQSKRFPIFVACRLGEIHEDTNISQWHWVPSEMNVADQATKEKKIIDLSQNSEWFSGPDFLKSTKEHWPVEPNCSIEFEQILHVRLDDAEPLPMEFPDISRFSKFNRLIRSTAWILHFKKMIRIPKQLRVERMSLGVEEIKEAQTLWIRKSQRECFEEEMLLLKKGKCLPKSNRLYKLSVLLDENEILRLGGRIPDSNELNIPFESRNPIILDPKHKFTELLIDWYHQEANHVGLETVINNLRLKFWILNIRTAVKKNFRKCQACNNRKCKPQAPEMGMLPPERLSAFTFPFTFVGIDFFGPITVAIGRRVEKRYGVLFTCLTVRAIHIELATSLETSSAINAIRRFMCRRGQPKEFRTDNGTNFVGAERELRECIKQLDHNLISQELSLKHISWKFNPPGAPHMGGIWERMIRSIKTALKISLKSINPKEEVLVTLLTEIEYIVNSRPLTHISVDPNEPEAITPNHFLLLRPGDVKSYGDFQLSSRKQWRIAQALADLYWRRWVREYRPTLIRRQKWHDKTDPIKIGDIVLVVDEKAPRNQWTIGRVEETYPGRDGVIRVVQIKTQKGSYTRPVAKLCILPLNH